ncbi:IS110 family transposase [Streptosporangium nondiastaticum]|uniref:IS110 family transposase n=1 Tax=Streptosporangium nondiastaticum TaxID=35764 RepID=UPI001CB983A1
MSASGQPPRPSKISINIERIGGRPRGCEHAPYGGRLPGPGAVSPRPAAPPRVGSPHAAPRTTSCSSRWGDNPEHLDSEAFFAVLCGVSPVERSSGRRQFRRLNRGGDRQANAALHRIVFTRLRVGPRTQDSHERRIKEGKTRREIVPCLKHYVAREVFHLVGQLQPGPRS